MNKTRMEAFSDGAIAVIIKIMVLERKVPHGAEWRDLSALFPAFLTYVLSFVYIGIYWSNHHHMLYAVQHIDGGLLWANLHLLFWLSVVPFATGWMGENYFQALPTALFGFVPLMCALAYTLLQRTIIRVDGKRSVLATAVGADRKGKVSQLACLLAIPLAFVDPRLAGILYVVVAFIWLVPDQRIEKVIAR